MLKFTKYNQYESLVMPLVKWLRDHGVVFQYGTEVTDVDFDISRGRKQATRVHWLRDGVEGGADLGPDDLLFMTIGSLTENSADGDHHTPAKLNSTYDIRMRLSATGRLRDGEEINIPGPHFVRDLLMKKLDKTQIGALLREFGLVEDD